MMDDDVAEIQIMAPGLSFRMRPRDSEDMAVVRVALRDANRRVRREMRPKLPKPESD